MFFLVINKLLDGHIGVQEVQDQGEEEQLQQ